MIRGSSCTTILVGKKATIDGSTMIARNDDTHYAITPQKFIIRPARKNDPGKVLKSWLNGFRMELPANAQAVPAVPNVDYRHRGYYDESGINEQNVCMSCTESTYGNPSSLAYDPYVKDGLDEDCMQTAVLPYISSAREGISYLGELIKRYGSAAGNSVLFADAHEVWYMEIGSGHHWVAERIPDDCYAVAANRISIGEVNFDDPEHFMWSDGIQEHVERHHLNPDHAGWNYAHIFGTATEEDRHYNTSRVWYAQKYLNPEIEQDPEDCDLPFIRKASRLITREDIQFILGSHYEETEFDPLGTGDEQARKRYRPIGVNRTNNAHILQLLPIASPERAAIMWLCLGGPSFTPFIPFFTHVKDTDPSFSHTSMQYNARHAWWYYKQLAVMVESHYPQFTRPNRDYLHDLNTELRARVEDIIARSADLEGDELMCYLTRENQKTVRMVRDASEKHMGEMLKKSIEMSKLGYNIEGYFGA